MTEKPRVTPIRRRAGPPPTPPRRRRLSVAAAAQIAERDLLVALLDRIATVIDAASPRDLAALSRHVVTIRRELAVLDRAAAYEAERAAAEQAAPSWDPDEL